MGTRVKPVVDRITNTAGLTVHEEAPKYPASIFPSATDTSYLKSRSDGVAALRGEINRIANGCTKTKPKIWLAGYSQGADVISKVMSSIGDTDNDLSSRAIASINGTVLTGSPTYIGTDRVTSSGSTEQNGLLPYVLGALKRNSGSLDGWTSVNSSGQTIMSVRSYCASHDFFCNATGKGTAEDPGGAMAVHNNTYQKSKYVTAQAAFLRQFS